MNKKQRRLFKIRKGIYQRVLCTETTPFECPICFSNDGLYEQVCSASNNKLQKLLLDELVFDTRKQYKYTIPWLYSIRKDSNELRQLALLHPLAQWRITEIYRDFDRLILHYCNRSKQTLRSPSSIAGSYYIKNENQNLNQYKTKDIGLKNLDSSTKHSPTYFAYRGYDRIYKFFDSLEFLELESRFAYLASLDVAKCFDSVYTHTIAWVLKGKAFAKDNVKDTQNFANIFDKTMQYSNYGETNGIVIGPESSRIFAEILLQEVDETFARSAALKGFILGQNYDFRRYVDDIFVFAKSSDALTELRALVVESLRSIHLQLNKEKSLIEVRPFFTQKSAVVRECKKALEDFIESFLVRVKNTYQPNCESVRRSRDLLSSFIADIKLVCRNQNASFNSVSALIISLVTERLKRLVAVSTSLPEGFSQKQYSRALLLLMRVIFFFFTVDPQVSSSYRVGAAVVLTIRFTRKYLPDEAARVYDELSSLSRRFFDATDGIVSAAPNVVRLELINLAIAFHELTEREYALSSETLRSIFLQGAPPSYFHLIGCLFYIGGRSQYDGLMPDVIRHLEDKLNDLTELNKDTEKTLLFLDCLFCPLIH